MTSVKETLLAHALDDEGCRCGWRMQPISEAIGVSLAVAHQSHLHDELRKLMEDRYSIGDLRGPSGRYPRRTP